MASLTVKEQLLAGGITYIEEQGTSDLTVRRLATAAGRTTMCVYTKFGSRAGYLTALYEQFSAELLANLDDRSPRAYICSLRFWALSHRGGWDLLARTPLGAIELPAERRARLFAELANRLAEILPGGSARARAQWLLAGAYGLIALAPAAAIAIDHWDEEQLAASWELLLAELDQN